MTARVIVAGSRTFNDFALLEQKLDALLVNLTDIEIVSGGARGADKLGEMYAKKHELPYKVFLADWDMGKDAGFIRNEEMAAYASAEGQGYCVVFWDGQSNGTRHMRMMCETYGLKLRTIIF
jgi:hypothetical protein